MIYFISIQLSYSFTKSKLMLILLALHFILTFYFVLGLGSSMNLLCSSKTSLSPKLPFLPLWIKPKLYSCILKCISHINKNSSNLAFRPELGRLTYMLGVTEGQKLQGRELVQGNIRTKLFASDNFPPCCTAWPFPSIQTLEVT